jgi:hypothetical protein
MRDHCVLGLLWLETAAVVSMLPFIIKYDVTAFLWKSGCPV